jgi:putative transposase
MPNYRRLFQPGGTFFFTLVTCRRHRLFADEFARECLRDAIRSVQADMPFDLTAIALMPNHLHFLWKLPPEDSDYSARWSCIKRAFSKRWMAAGGRDLAVSKARQKHREYGIWQKRFWEHKIRDETDLIRHVNYIHYNPVKHGFARCPHLWPYSSFHQWVKDGYYRADWLCDCQGPAVVPPELKHMDSTGE